MAHTVDLGQRHAEHAGLLTALDDAAGDELSKVSDAVGKGHATAPVRACAPF
jgi:hypothetical protein